MAVFVLGDIKDNFALTALFDAMVGDISADVRAMADFALSGWSRAELEAILSGDYEVATRTLAANLLGERGETLSVLTLSHALNDSYEQVRGASLDALHKMGRRCMVGKRGWTDHP